MINYWFIYSNICHCFVRYFSQQAAKKKATQPDDYDSDAGSVDDEEFDNFLGKS